MLAAQKALKGKEWDLALGELENALALAPDLGVAHLARVYVLSQLDRHSEVIADAQTALGHDADTEIFTLKSIAHYRLDEPVEALAEAQNAAESSPESATACQWLSLMLGVNDRFEDALEAVTRATELDGEFADGWSTRGLVLHTLDRPLEALADIEKAILLRPESAAHWLRKGHVLAALERWHEASEAFDRATTLDPESLEGWARKSFALSELGRGEAALDAADRAINIDATASLGWQSKGVALTALNRSHDAWVAFAQAREIDPDDATAWLNESVGLANLGRLEEALAAGRRAEQLDTADVETWLHLGLVLLELEEYTDATAQFERVLEADPAQHAARVNLGVAQGRSLPLEVAIATFREALQLQPADPLVWTHLADAYNAVGQHESAARAYRHAWQLAPADPERAAAVAVDLIRRDRNAEAMTFFEELQARGLEDSLLEFNRGLALYRLNRKAEAIRAWERAAGGDPPIEQADELLKAITPEGRPGAWFDYWFGHGGGWGRRVLGVGLVAALVVTLALPILEKDLVPGLVSGSDWQRALVPAIGLILLLVLPALSRITAGPVALETPPVARQGEAKHFSPVDVPPALTVDEIDLSRLY
jgi:tetratricopeptide (TPR) repeat protein